MTYQLGTRSKEFLAYVHKDIRAVVEKAIEITPIDFTVTAGKRTLSEQKEMVAKGVSQTLKSRHIDGTAVDLAPIVDGKISFDWQYFFPLAQAMKDAANELGIKIRWGGCWDFINDKEGKPEDWVEAYKNYRKSLGKKAFLDGPHFDLG